MSDDTPAPEQRAPRLSAAQPPPPPPPPGAIPSSPPASAPPPPPPPVPTGGGPFVSPPLLTGMIAVNSVSKFYGSVVAVSEVSFAIDQGVTALLGPNGAGKSTLFRMLCGLTPASRGTLRVLGEDPRRDRDVRGSIGLVPQQDALFDHLTATEFVAVAARTQGVDAVDIDRVVRWALEQVDLHDVGFKPVGQFSKGMRQRVKVAAALVNDPQILVLDEPLTGLDPVQRRRMIALFHRLGDEGRCVLVSSHVLDEVARLGSNVLVVAQGRLIARGDYRDLRELMDDRPHRIRLGSSDPRRLATALVGHGLVSSLTLHDSHVVVETLDVDALGRQLAPIAVDLGVRLDEVHSLDDDLESVFRYLVEGR
ncbi:ABC transporter ATP-binding protein [bacterium]|nr:ABC transporter ATP-binding protein [bacterium]